jgi:MraZ protein
MEKYAKEFETASAYEEDKKLSLLRHFFNSIEEVEEDGQGRVLLPKELVAYAGLEKDIVISGSGDRLEIWNATVYDETVGNKAFDQVLKDIKED